MPWGHGQPGLIACCDNEPMLTVYGIPNCDTVKKARAWLDAQGLPHQFHDFKKAGVPSDRLAQWAQAAHKSRWVRG